MLKPTVSAVVLLVLGAVTVDASESPFALLSEEPGAAAWLPEKDGASECTGGAIRDDGSFENAIRIPFVSDARFVQLLQPTSYPSILNRVCVCWSSSQSLESMSYSLLVYDDNGASGQPGSLLGGKVVSAVNLNAFTRDFFGYECSDLNVNLTSGGAYVGVSWNSASEFRYFLCTDESTSTPAATMFTSSNAGTTWTPVSSGSPGTRALGIRAQFGAGSSGACVSDADTLCLNGGRFKVEATFNTNSQSGTAQVVKLTDETGYMWFFNANNVETVVKVLNACAVNNRYWVFAGGLTDQGVVITVTDTVTQLTKTYTNTRGQTWVTITDTNALAACP
jgi:hypothetical protein